ncbi:hypothetical protein H6P81_007335 [Aristolochia fimbriata]|uniref:RNase H type-1 domain-containing protein n=1 Tax=Aristolochia fimbriata TaxID=158543 RepID=A0AAV7F138_ARIFI|nr:hypothetical protein H6P81_007335 [Aristolochia fimbriata]
MAVEMKLPQLNIYGDSALVIKQLTGEFEVKKLELVPFWRHADELLAQISEASLHYVPRSENRPADALAGIGASLAQFDERPRQVPICDRWVVPPPAEKDIEEEQIEEIEESLPISASQNEMGDWREPITNFLRYSILPVDLRERVHIRRAATKRLGYYWPTMLGDATEMARTCKLDGQRHAIQKQSHGPLLREISHTTADIVGLQPVANGIVKAFNKTLCKILKKIIGANKKSWDEKLDEALWSYRTSFRTPTQSTPYSLVYGTEAVFPLEVQLPSLQTAIREGLTTGSALNYD